MPRSRKKIKSETSKDNFFLKKRKLANIKRQAIIKRSEKERLAKYSAIIPTEKRMARIKNGFPWKVRLSLKTPPLKELGRSTCALRGIPVDKRKE